MVDPNNGSIKDWYVSERDLYHRLSDSVRSTLTSAITHASIPLLSVTARAKEIESFAEKIKRKSYENPAVDMTDLAGVRVITYFESDVARVEKLIRSTFHVHEDKSGDKGEALGSDKFGYRSVHLICDLGETRLKLPENIPYSERLFEIQVRSILQHAWAEIEHDRGYKFPVALPPDINRRLKAAAALLEVADGEFNRIAWEIEEYAKEVRSKNAAGDLSSRINIMSLVAYIDSLGEKLNEINLEPYDNQFNYVELIDEITALGVENLEELNRYFTDDFFRDENRVMKDQVETYIGVIRHALMYADMERYFSLSGFRWEWLTMHEFSILEIKYGRPKVWETLRAYIIPFDYMGRIVNPNQFDDFDEFDADL